MLTVTVTKLNKYTKSLLESDKSLSDIYIRAEISNFKEHFKSGHLYFNLKDEKSSVKAVMFSGNAKYLKFSPEDGMEILAKASVSLYEVDGSFQVYVTDLQPFGVGAIEIALRQLIEKLEKKGYFLQENKLILPQIPQTIGVVTSKTGAVIEDIKKVVSKRYPIALIKLYSSSVQGEKSVESLVQGINALDGSCDVIIIARGGGSKEDLSAFNSERLAEAIFDCKTPIISAVGHETDNSICDMVADVRASTPTMAAELATPSRIELLAQLKDYQIRAQNLSNYRINMHTTQLKTIKRFLKYNNPINIINNKLDKLDFIQKTVYNNSCDRMSRLTTDISSKSHILDTLSPFKVLSRGYAVVSRSDKPIKSVSSVRIDDTLSIMLYDGKIETKVLAVDTERFENEQR